MPAETPNTPNTPFTKQFPSCLLIEVSDAGSWNGAQCNTASCQLPATDAPKTSNKETWDHGPQDFAEALKAHTLATNVPLNSRNTRNTRFILLLAVLLVATPEKVAPLHECQTGPGIQEFAAANKPPWIIFPWLIPQARASRLITPWIILCPLSPLLWRHGFYAKIAGAIKCSNLKLVATQLDQPGNNLWNLWMM